MKYRVCVVLSLDLNTQQLQHPQKLLVFLFIRELCLYTNYCVSALLSFCTNCTHTMVNLFSYIVV